MHHHSITASNQAKLAGQQNLALIFQIKNSFLFLLKSVKSHKKLAFWSIYSILSLMEKFTAFIGGLDFKIKSSTFK